MEAWELWQEMARESERAARLAEAGDCLRSAASRYYYAAYQMVSALLLYQGLAPPAEREAWSHEDTPALLQDQLRILIRSRDTRNDLAQRLVDLYRLRIIADYQGNRVLSRVRAARAGQDARYILRALGNILPKGKTVS